MASLLEGNKKIKTAQDFRTLVDGKQPGAAAAQNPKMQKFISNNILSQDDALVGLIKRRDEYKEGSATFDLLKYYRESCDASCSCQGVVYDRMCSVIEAYPLHHFDSFWEFVEQIHRCILIIMGESFTICALLLYAYK